jgi:hypothetical protein
MSVEQVLYWRLTCNVENTFVWTYRGVDDAAPTLCPNDHANRTNISDVTLVGSVSSNEVIATQNSFGLFEAKTYTYPLPGNSIGEVSIFNNTWPNTIQVWELVIEPNAACIGDRVSICVAPGTPIGVLTAAVSSGVLLTVPVGTIMNENVMIGAYIVLDDMVNNVQQDMGVIVSKNPNTFQLTVQNAVTNSFPIGTVVRQYLFMVKDMLILRDNAMPIGRKGFAGRTIPANVPVQMTVVNNNGQAKDLHIYSEIYKT